MRWRWILRRRHSLTTSDWRSFLFWVSSLLNSWNSWYASFYRFWESFCWESLLFLCWLCEFVYYNSKICHFCRMLALGRFQCDPMVDMGFKLAISFSPQVWSVVQFDRKRQMKRELKLHVTLQSWNSKICMRWWPEIWWLNPWGNMWALLLQALWCSPQQSNMCVRFRYLQWAACDGL